MAAALRDAGRQPVERPRAGAGGARGRRGGAPAEVAALVGARARGDRVHLGRHRGERPGASAGSLRRGGRAPRRRAPARRVVAARAPVGAGARSTRCAASERLVRRGRRPDGADHAGGAAAALRPDTALVTLAPANHELGNVYDVAALARRGARRRARCSTPTPSQAAGKLALDVAALGVDALTRARRTSSAARKGRGRCSCAAGVRVRAARRRAATRSASGAPGPRTSPASSASAWRRGSRARELARARRRGVAALRDRLEARLLAHPGRAAPRRSARAGCPGRSTSGSRARPGSWSRSRSTSKGCACRRARPAPRARSRRRRCCSRSGCRAPTAAEAMRFGLGRDNDEAEIDRVAALLPRSSRACAARGQRPRRRGSRRPARAGRRRDVGRRRFLDGGGAAGRRGLRGVGVTLRLYDARGHGGQHRRALLRPARHRGRARDRRAPRHPALRDRRERGLPRAASIDDFVAEHRAGRTPNPCVRCNERLKFGPLLAFADAVGADALATGPLRAPRARAGRAAALRARASTRQGPVVLPVRRAPRGAGPGALPARRQDQGRGARASRAASACPTPTSPSRSEICFIPDGDHVGLRRGARRRRAGRARSSTTRRARALGAHAGTHTFTVGQRRGPARRRGRAPLRAAHRRRDRRGAGRARASASAAIGCASPTCAGSTRRRDRRAAAALRGPDPPPRRGAAPAWVEPGRGRRRRRCASTSRPSASRPARRRCSTTTTSGCWAAAGFSEARCAAQRQQPRRFSPRSGRDGDDDVLRRGVAVARVHGRRWPPRARRGRGRARGSVPQ